MYQRLESGVFPDHIYANHRVEELWRFGDRAELLESREDRGWAETSSRGGQIHIVASDDFSGKPEVERRLEPPPLPEKEQFRNLLGSRLRGTGATARIASLVRLVHTDSKDHLQRSTNATVSFPDGLALTVSAVDATNHLDAVLSLRGEEVVPRSGAGLAMVWRGGSGAVLLHEAVGHPAERERFHRWPAWMEVSDEPGADTDDVGENVGPRTLTADEPPAAMRRQDFRSVPIRRLTNLTVRAWSGMELPDPRLEIWLVDGGMWDAARDTIRLQISGAVRIDGSVRERVSPFVFEESCQQLTARLTGATGVLTQYPGVVCSDEGQPMIVGSAAPDLILE